MITLEFLKKNYLITIFFFIFIFIPFVILELYAYTGILSLITRLLCFTALFLLCILLARYLEHKHPAIKIVLFFIFFVYYILTYVFAYYLLFARTPFKILINIEIGLTSLAHGIVGILNYINCTLIILAVVALFLFTGYFFKKITNNLPVSVNGKVIGIFVVITAILLITGNDLVVSSVITAYNDYELAQNNPVFFPDNNFSTTSNQNIIILQLESLNSKVVNEEYTPEFMNIAKDGVWYPVYYGNSIRTNRAQTNILCGINGHLQTPFSHHPQDINTTCLPQLLKNSGYKTLFFRSDVLEFTNTGNFMSEIGFEEIHHDDIMEEDSIKYPWGYDDIQFYQGVFKYLNKNYKDANNLFIYIEVSSHHYPFDKKEEYDNFVFPEPQSFKEKYINSVYVQDLAIKTFYKEFKKYDNGNTHLIVQGDHSWPIGINDTINNEKGFYEDNFATSMVFIGAKNSKFLKNGIVTQRFSEVDFIPTVFSILNNTEYSYSFSNTLKGLEPTKYDNCQMLVQPHMNMSLSVVKYPQKYVYRIDLEEINYFDLEKDPLEQNLVVLKKKVTLKDFLLEYGCDRYKDYYSNMDLEVE